MGLSPAEYPVAMRARMEARSRGHELTRFVRSLMGPLTAKCEACGLACKVTAAGASGDALTTRCGSRRRDIAPANHTLPLPPVPAVFTTTPTPARPVAPPRSSVPASQELNLRRLKAAAERIADGYDVPAAVVHRGRTYRVHILARAYASAGRVYIRRIEDGERSHNPIPVERIRLNAETAAILDEIADAQEARFAAASRTRYA